MFTEHSLVSDHLKLTCRLMNFSFCVVHVFIMSLRVFLCEMISLTSSLLFTSLSLWLCFQTLKLLRLLWFPENIKHKIRKTGWYYYNNAHLGILQGLSSAWAFRPTKNYNDATNQIWRIRLRRLCLV